MKNVNKFLTLLMMFSALVLVSCSNKSDEPKTTKGGNSETSADQAKSTAKVYQLISAESPKNGLAADFVWEQNGKQVKFSEFTKGKYVLLNFWGTWCPPCRRELPDIVQVADEMAGKNLIVMGIALERTNSMSEALDGVSTFWNTNSLNYPVIIGTGELADAYGGIQAVPTTFFIDDNGKIANMIEGARDKESFYTELNKIMKK